MYSWLSRGLTTSALLLTVVGLAACGGGSGSGGALPAAPLSEHDNSAVTGSTPPPASTPAPVATAAPVTPPPAAAGNVPAHVQTFAYLYGYAGAPESVPLSAVRPYVDWTQTDSSHAPALRSAGIKVQIYTDFWRNYSSDNPAVGYNDIKPGGAHAVAAAKTCSGSVIYAPRYGGGYEADPRSDAALGHAQVVIGYRQKQYGSQYDAVFADDTGTFSDNPLPCNYSHASIAAAINGVDRSVGVPMFVNTLGAEADPVQQTDFAQASNVLGAMCEECYASYNSAKVDVVQTGRAWKRVENAEIAMVGMRKIFWDYARAIGNPADETALRTYVYASFLLTYDPQYTMFQEAFKSKYTFPVMPETGLVPMNPLSSETDVDRYGRTGGAYMREFGNCYYRGVNEGPCAVTVNPGNSTVPVPSSAYAHSMALAGAGVLEGGSASFDAPAPRSLAPGAAAILFR